MGNVDNFCAETSNIWRTVGYFLLVFKIVIPIILIILGMVDLGKAVISSDDKIIVYLDKNTGDIYTLNLDGTYLNSYAYNASNVSKMIVIDKNIYILSRTENELQVIDTEIKDIIFKQPLAKKPVDMLLIDNKIYILCAVGEIDVFNLDDFSCNTLLKLPEVGFSKKLVRVDGSNVLLITNVTDKKYYVYDFVKNSVLQSVNTSVYINDLQLLNKRLN